MHDPHKDPNLDELSGVSTTGHEWDGIKELNNPLPRWWVLTFYACIVWALGYTVFYPAWPLLTSATTGVLGYSSRADVRTELAAAEAARSGYAAAIKAADMQQILADETLRTVATAAGNAAFKVNCIQCHGSGAQGSKGFPNLNDDDWLWGGTPQQILTTITHGVRAPEDADTHVSEMPAFADILKPAEIASVATFVADLPRGTGFPAEATPGAQIFAQNCASCHGDRGEGNQEMGAPNLADTLSLLVDGEEAVAAQIRAPKHGVMPAWGDRLGDVTVKELAAYVYSLGGGK
ncbi:cytochrome-c oxidase, cbb3-type subunit III [Pararhizobium sp. DWP1-1-3]|uniref:cytochrome-c oxidase, cbb3-type subunit III n=1 Tax=Pararhizobium sp. DWP1-1-3 TaxID=2804652 RepID=UPI003CF057A4